MGGISFPDILGYAASADFQLPTYYGIYLAKLKTQKEAITEYRRSIKKSVLLYLPLE